MARVGKRVYNPLAMQTLKRFFLRRFQRLPASSDDDAREVLPFFVVVMAVLAFLYWRALSVVPGLRQSPAVLAFTALMLLHAALHWFSPRLCTTLRRGMLYLAGQGACAFVLTMLSRDVGIVLGLYGALIGEAVGILRGGRLAVIAVAAYFGLAVVSVILVGGVQDLGGWLLVAAFVTLFTVIYVVMYVRQTEARARAQALLAELETAHRELAEYAARVQDLTIAAERQRMARELHDTLSQGLAGLILQLEAADSHLASGRAERAQAILRQAMERARTALSDARRAIDDLRQSAAAPVDLAETVREEAQHFASATGIRCEIEIGETTLLPERVREQTARIVSEALTNIARHAQASHAWVTLNCENGSLDLVVRDDGRGFDLAASEAGHYGLLGMRERARLAGGTLTVESAPGRGTVIRLSVPLDEHKAVKV